MGKDILNQFKSVENKKVFDTQGQGEYGWHEQRLAEYDVVALDMCTIVGTSNPDLNHQNRWFRNYYRGAIGSPGICDAPTEIDMPYVPSQAECEPIKTLNTVDVVKDDVKDNEEKDMSEFRQMILVPVHFRC